MANEHIINNNLVISGSVTSSIGFFGDGTGLTNITSTAEWDGSRIGNASITGSLVVSGSNVSVDFSNATAVTGSFSGSFVGNGSGLTGLNNFPFTGNATISGSLLVSGSNLDAVDFQGIDNIRGGQFSGSFIGNGSGLTNLNINGTQASGSNLSGSFSGSFQGDGSGLTGTVSEWDGSRNGDSSITGSLVVSGSSATISLSGETTIDKNILISNKGQLLDISIGSGSLPTSTVERSAITIGAQAGKNLTSGSNNILIGQCAGSSNICAGGNIAIGSFALCNNIGRTIGSNQNGDNVAIGLCAMKSQICSRHNVAVGSEALKTGGSGITGAVAIGHKAGCSAGGNFSISIGCCAAATNDGGSNVAIGMRSLVQDSCCSIAIGTCALLYAPNGNCNIAVGVQSGRYATSNSSNNVYIGHQAGPSVTTTQCKQLYISNGSGESNALIRGDFRTKQVTISTQVSASIFSGSFVGDGSGLSGVSGSGFPFEGDGVVTGSLLVSQSSAAATSFTINGGHTILTQVSKSLDFPGDTEAAAGGVPLGGIYRSGNVLAIRIQ